jgi:heme exporter protein A
MRLHHARAQATLLTMNALAEPLWSDTLTCRRGGRRVFTDLAFRVAPGEALIVTGPNGAGKSSLLRLLAGLGQPAEGAIYWGRDNIADDPVSHRARTAYLGHLDGIKPRATVADHLALAATLAGTEAAQVPTVAERVGLGGLLARPGRLLSAGQRRRVGLGRLLLSGARLWLLDEPTNALDAAGQTVLAGLLRAHLAGGGMIVAATHQGLNLPGHMLALPGFVSLEIIKAKSVTIVPTSP